MIGKGKSVSHTIELLKYVEEKIESQEIDRNKIIGETPQEIASEFRIFQSFNTRCKNKTLSFVVSPTIADGKKLTKFDFSEITKDFLKELRLDKNQYISYLHKDRSHLHMHIIVNRINYNGEAHKDHFISKRAQNAAEKIAINRNFTTAKEIQLEKEKSLKRIIKEAHDEIIKQKPADIEMYTRLMKEYNILLYMKKAKDNKIVGLKFKIGKQTINGSAIHKNLSAKNLQKTIESLNKPSFNHYIRRH